MNLAFVDAESKKHFRWVIFNKKFEKVELGTYREGDEKLKTTVKIDGIFLGVPRHLFVAKEIELPPLSYDNVKEALSYRIPKLFYFIQDPFFVFFALRDDFSKVLVFVCEREEIERLICDVETTFQSKVVAVFFSAMAIASFLKSKYDTFILKVPREEGLETVVVSEGALRGYFFLHSEDSTCFQNQLCSGISQRYILHWEAEESPSGGEAETAVKINSEIFSYIYTRLKKDTSQSNWLFNFFPERKRLLKEDHITHRLVIYFFIASCVFLAISPLFRLSKEINYLKKKTTELTPEVKKLKTLGTDIEKKEQEIQAVLKHFKLNKLEVLAQVSQALPKGVDIEYIRVYKNTLRLMGYAPKAADVLTALSKVKILKQAKFSGPIIKGRGEKANLERFTIEANLAQNS